MYCMYKFNWNFQKGLGGGDPSVGEVSIFSGQELLTARCIYMYTRSKPGINDEKKKNR